MEEQGIDTYDLRNPEKKGGAKRNIEKEIEDLYAYPITKNEMNEEMGIKADGSLARPSAAGLGGNQENAAQVSLQRNVLFGCFVFQGIAFQEIWKHKLSIQKLNHE